MSVTLLNHQNISSTFETAIEWDHKNEFVLEVPVQTYLRNIGLKVTAKVDTYAGKPQDLESSHSIFFKDSASDAAFVELFLFRDQESYKVQLLGKNGEPKPNMNLSITVSSIYHNGSITKSLMTNERGYVTLGALNGVNSISVQSIATPDVETISGSWRLESWRNETQYSQYLYFKKGDELSLPLPSHFDIKHDIEFVKIDSNTQQFISNEKSHLHIQNGRLVGKLEHAGVYALRFVPHNTSIIVNVLEGKTWESEGQLYDQKNRGVVSFHTNNHQLIGLGAPKIHSGEDGHTVEV